MGGCVGAMSANGGYPKVPPFHAMLLTHAKWRSFTQRKLPAPGTCGVMLALALDSRDAVDALNRAAALHGGQADANPVQDLGFMYNRALADPDGHVWEAFWMDPAAIPQADRPKDAVAP
jgi:uncharacterized protein